MYKATTTTATAVKPAINTIHTIHTPINSSNKLFPQAPSYVTNFTHARTTAAITGYAPQLTSVPKEVKFYPPEIKKHYPTWTSEKVTLEDNWLVTHVPDGVKISHRDLINNRDFPGVFFTPRVYNEMTYVVESLAPKTGECAMFALVKKVSPERPHWLVYDWFLSKQTASSAEVKLDVPDFDRYFKYLRENNGDIFSSDKDLHNQLMHAHSHHTMNMCSWSGTDMNQQTSAEELARQGDYRIFFLFTIGHGLKATLVNYATGLTRQEMYIGLCFSDPEYVVPLTNKRKRELDEQMGELVSKTVPRGGFTFDWDAPEGTVEEFKIEPTYTEENTQTAYNMLTDDQADSAELILARLIPVVSHIMLEDGKAFIPEAWEKLKGIVAQKKFDKLTRECSITDYLPGYGPSTFKFDLTKRNVEELDTAVCLYTAASTASEFGFDFTEEEMADAVSSASAICENLAIALGEIASVFAMSDGLATYEALRESNEMGVTFNEYTAEDLSVISTLIKAKGALTPEVIAGVRGFMQLYVY